MENDRNNVTASIPEGLSDDGVLRQKLLVANLWVIMATIVTSCVLIAPLSDGASGEILLGLLPYGIANSVALWLAYRGRVLLSLVEFSFVLFSMHAASLFLLGELPPHFFLGMVNFIILNGVVLGGRAALVTTAVTVFCGLGFPKLGKINSEWTESIANAYGLQIVLSEETLSLSIFTTTCSTGFLIATTLRLQAATRGRLREALSDLHTAQEHLELRRVRAEELAALGSRLAVATNRDDVLKAVDSSLATVMSGEAVQWAESAPASEERGIRFGSGPDARWLVLRRDAPSHGLAFMRTVAELQESALARINSVDRLSMAARLEGVGRFAASIAHDFNNLLVPIAGAQEMLEREASLSNNSRELLTRSRSATDRAAALVGKLLTHSRVREPEKGVLNVAARLESLEPLLRTFLSCGVSLEKRIEVEGAFIRMDAVEFDQVILNLVLNARDAMMGSGRIIITVSEEQACIKVEVQDDGPGIPEKIRAWVVEPFHTTREEGTGLGLATVSRVLDELGGSLEIGDGDLGGAALRMRFPRAEGTQPATGRQKREGKATPRIVRRVLLVDDEEAVLFTTAELLRARGHIVTTADSTATGLEALKTGHGFSIVISDFQMMDGTGMELLVKLRSRADETPFIILSGYGAAVPSGSEHKPDSIVAKPASVDELDEVIQRYTMDVIPSDVSGPATRQGASADLPSYRA